jgi:hypothetical protein
MFLTPTGSVHSVLYSPNRFMITGTQDAAFIGGGCKKKKLGSRFFLSGGTKAEAVTHKSTYVCLFMFLTWKSGASWPAQGSRGRKNKSRKLYMCPCVHIISRTHDVYLYKSVKTPTCKGSIVCVKHESLGQTTCCWVSQNKYCTTEETTCVSMERAQSDRRMRPGWMHLRGAASDSRSSMYGCV